MKFNWKSIVRKGLKILAGAVAGIALYVGLDKLAGEKKEVEVPLDNGYYGPENQVRERPMVKFKTTGNGIIDMLNMGQSAIMSLLGLIGGLATVAEAISQVTDREYYNKMSYDPRFGNPYTGGHIVPNAGGGYYGGQNHYNNNQQRQMPYNPRPAWLSDDEPYEVRVSENIVQVW